MELDVIGSIIVQIVNYLNINYSLLERNITLTDVFYFPFFKIFLNRNKSEIVSYLIISDRFNITPNTDIYSQKVKYFIEEYSRTLPTDTGFTYYFVFCNTVNLYKSIY